MKNIVLDINKIFYEVEAELYDERHPEVLEGNRVWWDKIGNTLLKLFRDNPPIRILDVGCGTGYVGDVLIPYLRRIDEFLAYDLSPSMLREARRKLNNHNRCGMGFVNGDVSLLPFQSNSFDVVTINALLHHLADAAPLLAESDRVLRRGGLVIVAHEPNKLFFESALARIAASAYKLLGQGMSITDEMQIEINKALKENNLVNKDLSKEEILKLVEFNSPVEQEKFFVPKDKGFIPTQMIRTYFPKYDVLELKEYSTFFIRPVFQQYRLLGRIAKSLNFLLGGRGNLFSFVCQKQ